MFALKIICLFLAVLFTLSNTMKLIAKNDIGAVHFILQTVGITGFIVLQWLI